VERICRGLIVAPFLKLAGETEENHIFSTWHQLDVIGQLHASVLWPGGKSQDSGWTPESGWTLWRRDKPVTLTWNRTQIPRPPSP
jgi:hypothetical protein